jgi:hypothetical protein
MSLTHVMRPLPSICIFFNEKPTTEGINQYLYHWHGEYNSEWDNFTYTKLEHIEISSKAHMLEWSV